MRQEFDKLATLQLSFVEFIQQSPLFGLDLKLTRDKSLTRQLINPWDEHIGETPCQH